MKIGIIGSGHIGGTTARLFAGAGHDVRIANSRGPESLREEVAELGPRVEAAEPRDAVAWADLVLLALPWRGREALADYGPWDGKLVVDATNAFGSGGIIDLGDGTSSEAVLEVVPGARLVKAFNTMNWQPLGSEGRPDAPEEERLVLFVAGDDPEAKEVVSALVREVGFAPVETGSLREGGRSQQPGTPIFNDPMRAAEARKRMAVAARG